MLAEACNYPLTLWTRLTRFLEHPVLDLSKLEACMTRRLPPLAVRGSRRLLPCSIRPLSSG
jgi:hypothetical protein